MRSCFTMTAILISSTACFQATVANRGAAASSGPIPVLPATLTPPSRLGRYLMVDQLAHENIGTLFKYTDGAASQLSVFVYPVGADVKVGTVAQGWTSTEGYKFATSMMQMVQNGVLRTFNMEMSRPDTLLFNGARIPGYISVASTQARGGPRLELEFVYLVRDHFLRVRTTSNQLEWDQSDVPSFARQLALRFAAPPPLTHQSNLIYSSHGSY